MTDNYDTCDVETEVFVDDDDVYLKYFSGKGFHINYSVYISYVKHINSSNKA
jgi:hypothetical protein